MKAYLDTNADRQAPPQFDAPGNIVLVTLDSGITEAFINGTQPQGAGVVPAAQEETPLAVTDVQPPAQ
jgi:hypothetical protein